MEDKRHMDRSTKHGKKWRRSAIWRSASGRIFINYEERHPWKVDMVTEEEDMVIETEIVNLGTGMDRNILLT